MRINCSITIEPIIESHVLPTGMQSKRAAKLLAVIGLINAKHANAGCHPPPYNDVDLAKNG